MLVDGTFQAVTDTELSTFFARRSTRAAQRVRLAVEQAEQLAEGRATARALAKLAKQIREWERSGIGRVRIRFQPKPSRLPKKERTATISKPSKALRPLPRYRYPVVDKQGNRGIYFEISYDAARTNKSGVAKRRIAYMHKMDHLEFCDGSSLVASNMGHTLDEIEACADTLEAANRSARANAIVGFVSIIQCPPEFDQVARADLLNRIATQFGSNGLPFCIAAHQPDPDGDQRNFHFHLWHSHRPCERVSAYEWAISEQLRADMNGPAAMRRLRYEIAKLTTEVAHAHGHKLRFTHLSNAARGLHHRPTRKLGPAKTKLAREGEFVADAVANAIMIAENEALEALLQQRESSARLDSLRAEFTPRAHVAIDFPRRAEANALVNPSRANSVVVPEKRPQPVLQLPVNASSTRNHEPTQMRNIPLLIAGFSSSIVTAADKSPHKAVVRDFYSKQELNVSPKAINLSGLSALKTAFLPNSNWRSAKIPLALPTFNTLHPQSSVKSAVLSTVMPKPRYNAMPCYEWTPIARADVKPFSFIVRPAGIVFTVNYPLLAINRPPQIASPICAKPKIAKLANDDLLLKIKAAIDQLESHPMNSKPLSAIAMMSSPELRPEHRNGSVPISDFRPAAPQRQQSGVQVSKDTPANSPGTITNEQVSNNKTRDYKTPPRDIRTNLPTNAIMSVAAHQVPASVPAASVPIKTMQQIAATNPSYQAVLQLIQPAGRPSSEALLVASKALGAWFRHDPQTVKSTIAALFEQMRSVPQISRWSTLRRQTANEDSGELKKLTEKLFADAAVMARIRTDAPLLELVLFTTLKQLSAEASSPRGTTVLRRDKTPKRDEVKQVECKLLPPLDKSYAAALDEALRSKNERLRAWAKAELSRDQNEIKRTARLLRNDIEADRAANALDPRIIRSIVSVAPNRNMRDVPSVPVRSNSDPVRSIGIIMDRDFGIEPD